MSLLLHGWDTRSPASLAFSFFCLRIKAFFLFKSSRNAWPCSHSSLSWDPTAVVPFVFNNKKVKSCVRRDDTSNSGKMRQISSCAMLNFKRPPLLLSRFPFYFLFFLRGSREFWLRRIWTIKVVFSPLRNAKQTFWKWKDFLLIPFHAHLLSSEVTMGPEEAAWGHQMECRGAEEVGMGGGGGSYYSDLVPLCWSQHAQVGSGGGDPVAARHLAWPLSFP